MSKTAIVPKNLVPPVGPFSQGIRINGLLFLSGQVGLDPATGKLVPGGIRAETEQVLRNLAAVLEAAGKTFTDVVRAGVFLTDIGDFSAMNAVYEKQFIQPYPARTTIAVAALPLGARVEIDLVAAD
jgi:2-iminobutanoate/2-iminopropanoate deaminase